MRSIALFALLSITGCRCACPCPCPWAHNDSSSAAPTPSAQIGPPTAPRDQPGPAPAQRVVIEVVQKPASEPSGPSQPAVRQALPPAPAPAAIVPSAGQPAGGIAAIPYQSAQPAGVLPAVAASPRSGRGLFLDVEAIFDWLFGPFGWLRVTSAPQLPSQTVVMQQMPQYVQPAGYVQAQPIAIMQQAPAAYGLCPPCPPCAQTVPPPVSGLTAAQLDELTRRVNAAAGH